MTAIDELLASYARFGIDLSLDRVFYLLEKLGNPQNQIPVIHVAGTNGKGSVCAFLSSILQASHYRVGRYTSPHLIDWRERICINQNLIEGADLMEALQTVIKVINDRYMPTQFELLTCAMWWYFAQEKVDIGVIETGLGGRLDATNVCDSPLVSIITSISRDHWQRLGDSLSLIAGEKAGIIKPGRPLVIGQLPPEAKQTILERAQALQCPVIEVKEGVGYRLPLLGKHQQLNCALATAAITQLQGWNITQSQIDRGIAQTQWQGRLEWTHYGGTQILLDGAHNLAGAQALRQYIDEIAPNRPLAWIIGILENKDYEAIVNALLRSGDWLFPVEIKGHQSVSPQTLVKSAKVPIHPQICDDLMASLHQAIAMNITIVLCGSLYLIGEFKSEINRHIRHSL